MYCLVSNQAGKKDAAPCSARAKIATVDRPHGDWRVMDHSSKPERHVRTGGSCASSACTKPGRSKPDADVEQAQQQRECAQPLLDAPADPVVVVDLDRRIGHANRQFLQAILHAIPESLLLLDSEGRILACNETAAKKGGAVHAGACWPPHDGLSGTYSPLRFVRGAHGRMAKFAAQESRRISQMSAMALCSSIRSTLFSMTTTGSQACDVRS